MPVSTEPPSLADVIPTLYCPAPSTKGLTKEQIAALHTFKDELTAMLKKLYLVVPQTKADELLRQFADHLP